MQTKYNESVTVLGMDGWYICNCDGTHRHRSHRIRQNQDQEGFSSWKAGRTRNDWHANARRTDAAHSSCRERPCVGVRRGLGKLRDSDDNSGILGGMEEWRDGEET